MDDGNKRENFVIPKFSLTDPKPILYLIRRRGSVLRRLRIILTRWQKELKEKTLSTSTISELPQHAYA